MDILNAAYLKAQGLIKTTAEPNSIVYLSVPDPRRDDKYLTIGVPIENMASVIGALQTVAVDGVTITGDGTPGNPLTVNIAGTGLVDSVTDDGLGWITVDNTDPENPIISFAGIAVDGVTITGTGLAGDPLVAVIPTPTIYGLFTQTADSTPVVATDPSGTLIGTGVGTLSVPANTFAIGDSFRAMLGGHLTSTNGQDMTIDVYANGNIIATTGLIPLKNATDKHWSLQIDFTIRTLGGTGSVAGLGEFSYIPNPAGQAFEGGTFSIVSTLDTTILNTLDVRVSFVTPNTDTIYSELFTLTKTY